MITINPSDETVRLSGIYMIVSPTAKVYIGQSKNLKGRLNTYKLQDCKSQIRLYNSLNKYGFENHLFEVIEYCDLGVLNERERYWQEEYQVLGEYGLNCLLTATHFKNCLLSDEVKKKISLGRKGKPSSKGMLGKKMSDATKKKMSDAKKGKKHSHEVKFKISQTLKQTLNK